MRSTKKADEKALAGAIEQQKGNIKRRLYFQNPRPRSQYLPGDDKLLDDSLEDLVKTQEVIDREAKALMAAQGITFEAIYPLQSLDLTEFNLKEQKLQTLYAKLEATARDSKNANVVFIANSYLSEVAATQKTLAQLKTEFQRLAEEEKSRPNKLSGLADKPAEKASYFLELASSNPCSQVGRYSFANVLLARRSDYRSRSCNQVFASLDADALINATLAQFDEMRQAALKKAQDFAIDHLRKIVNTTEADDKQDAKQHEFIQLKKEKDRLVQFSKRYIDRRLVS